MTTKPAMAKNMAHFMVVGYKGGRSWLLVFIKEALPESM